MRYLSSAQCRAARGLLGWTQPDLANQSKIHVQTISAFEKGSGTPSKKTLKRMTDVLEDAGIEFMDHDGLRRKQSELTKFEGADGFESFLDDVYSTAIRTGTKDNPCEIFLSNVHHQNWIKWMGKEKWANHVERMTKAREVMDVRIIIKEGDTNFPASAYSKYKCFPAKFFNDKSFYSYADKLAFLNFQRENVEITIMRQLDFAHGYRILFKIAWDYFAKTPSKLNIK
jgi:transcriptional regulator with XRE-family HTH domain